MNFGMLLTPEGMPLGGFFAAAALCFGLVAARLIIPLLRGVWWLTNALISSIQYLYAATLVSIFLNPVVVDFVAYKSGPAMPKQLDTDVLSFWTRP